jgi:asparagine synthase (glutamine-hydrolysing)
MFAGIFATGPSIPTGLSTSEGSLTEAINPFEQADVCGAWRDDRALIVQTLTWNTPESKLEQVPYRCATSGRIIAAWARLDNRDELMKKLAIDPTRRSAVTDPMLILAAFNRWGEECPEHLLGDFSFIIHDPNERFVFAARDPLGVRPLYYYDGSDVISFATTAAAFEAIVGLKLTPSTEWVATYLLGLSKSHIDTPWPEVKKLPGGHRLMVRLDPISAGVAPQRYFEFRDDSPQAFALTDHWLEEYRAILEESVRCRLRTDYPLGAETSGGLDSSTCLGFAAKLWPAPKLDIHTFGFVHLAEEPDFILETSRMHGLVNNHIHIAADLDIDLDERADRILRVLGYPEEHGNASAHEPFYIECQQYGVRTLLSGFGGDEVVTNPGGLLRRELIDSRRFGALFADMHGPMLLRPLRFARSIQRDRNGSKAPSGLRTALRERWPQTAIHGEVVDRYDLRRRHEEHGSFDEGYRTINSFILGNRLGNSFVPTRLENCTLMAQSRGVDYRWPLLDVRLVQQYLSTPSIEKKAKGMGRYLHRRAIEGVVPAKVQWKVSKDMGSPVSEGRPMNLKTAAAELRSNLHPLLEEVLDVDKLSTSASAADDAQVGGRQSKWMELNRQVRKANVLNHWLQRADR